VSGVSPRQSTWTKEGKGDSLRTAKMVQEPEEREVDVGWQNQQVLHFPPNDTPDVGRDKN
jgi:hypothetical protein